ncbi:MAG: hypothetical protein A4E31_01365 [Methanomassiliicoccales archaeon PtaU1.Bin030]|nr:MAG: hypothetical protein A4E31_01365 [Methanomassiliicoccales archaeon PtaU1.Bin030]
MALLRRLVTSCTIWAWSAITVGRGSEWTSASISSIEKCMFSLTIDRTSFMSTGLNSFAFVSMLENCRRSFTSCLIRSAPELTYIMYSLAFGSSLSPNCFSSNDRYAVIILRGSFMSWDATKANCWSSALDLLSSSSVLLRSVMSMKVPTAPILKPSSPVMGAELTNRCRTSPSGHTMSMSMSTNVSPSRAERVSGRSRGGYGLPSG